MSDLPLVDAQVLVVAAPRTRVWEALDELVHDTLLLPEGHWFARLWRTDPPAGFTVTESSPPDRVALAGRHRFSVYRLVLELTDAVGGATTLRATTYAAFPGVGRVYRVLLVPTGFHAIATRALLHGVRRRALRR